MTNFFSSIGRAIKYLFTNPRQFMDSLVKHFGFLLSDKTYLKLRYRFQMGEWPNLDNPTLFTEKIQWLKLHNRHPEYSVMVDKFLVKDYVARRIGDEYIIPTFNVWNSVEEIEWNTLPSQFVLKTTHGGGNGGVVICKDKSDFNKRAAIKKLKNSMSESIYDNLGEWPYRDVQPRIIAEKFMSSLSAVDLTDYKFFCFSGEPKYCQVIKDRNSNETIDFFDMEWNHQDFVGLNPKGSTSFANSYSSIKRPQSFSRMKDICRTLSKDKKFLRVDLYEIDDKVYFGELTFFPASGIGEFSPREWNRKLGSLIQLPL